MKKIISIIVVGIFVLMGCSNATEDNEKLNVVTTVYPIYDMVHQIAATDVNLSNIYPAGADIHEYELTSKDIAMIADSDIFLYISEESTPFVKGLKDSGKYNTKFINITEEEIFSKNSSTNTSIEDPHVWVSPKQNILLLDVVLKSLVEMDESKKDDYNAVAGNLKSQLLELDSQYANFGSNQVKEIYVAHDAYGYLNFDYVTNIIGIYGMHHDDEPSAQEISKIIDNIKAKNIKYVYAEQNDLSNSIVKQITNETGATILVLNNMATVSKENIDNHVSFIDMIKSNLENMEKIND
ncbi:MAG: metal ABC transporter substrate-binding protein [Mycoplasmatales bacterium]